MSKWLVGFTLVAVLGFGGLIYVLDQHEQGKTPPSLLSKLDLGLDEGESGRINGDGANKQSGDDKPQAGSSGFDFYKLLPKMEVSLPDGDNKAADQAVRKPASNEPQATAPENPTSAAANPQSALKPQVLAPISARFILQAGSFKNYSEADKRRAGLALLGVESKIQRVVLDNAQVWHRVRVGPFGDRQEVKRIRDRLKSNHIDTILLREVIKSKS